MEATADQGNVFIRSEADRYFERNKSALTSADWSLDLPLRLIDLYKLQPRSVVEVGAANGFRVATIAERFGARVVAVEPSAQAIADGKRRFPDVQFIQSLANEIPLQERFDLAIVNFVLHWVARDTLLKSVAEIDRLVVDGGFLIVGDFAATNQLRVKYHHLPNQEVYTYKQNYAAVFLASGIYHMVAAVTSGHAATFVSADTSEHERIGAWLLQKRLAEHYVPASAAR